MPWTKDQLTRIAGAGELHVSSYRPDGTLRRWTTIWVVRVDDDLYIRSAFGPEGGWYRTAMQRQRARIRAGGVETDVTLHPTGDAAINARVDEAYSTKLGRDLKGPTNWFTVVLLDPNRTLVLRSRYSLLTGQSFDPRSGRLPPVCVDGVWGFHLRPASGDATRLVVRTRSRSRPRLVTQPFSMLVGEHLHFILQSRQFHNLCTRVGAR